MRGLASPKTASRRLTALRLMAALAVRLLTLWLLLLRLPTRWYEAKDVLAYWSAVQVL